jgi:hypothetical protein
LKKAFSLSMNHTLASIHQLAEGRARGFKAPCNFSSIKRSSNIIPRTRHSTASKSGRVMVAAAAQNPAVTGGAAAASLM